MREIADKLFTEFVRLLRPFRIGVIQGFSGHAAIFTFEMSVPHGPERWNYSILKLQLAVDEAQMYGARAWVDDWVKERANDMARMVILEFLDKVPECKPPIEPTPLIVKAQ